MKPPRTWIVVADGARARILLNEGPGKGLAKEPLRTVDARIPPTRDLGSDRPGRAQAAPGTARHAVQPRADWHTFEKEKFARGIARIINRAADRNAFERLVLVAPSKTLGQMRQELGKAAIARLAGEAAKDMTGVSMHDLPKHLEGLTLL